MIKKVNLEKSLEIYKYLIEDFPKNEIPNYKSYLKLTENHVHNVYVYEEDAQEVAYFIAIEKNNTKKILITHLAVIKTYRGKGVGKRLIEAIKAYFSDETTLIVEVESEKNAKSPQELEIIKRRIQYYLNAGFTKCENLEYTLFHMDYYILTYSPLNYDISNKEIKQVIENIYNGLFEPKNLIIKLK